MIYLKAIDIKQEFFVPINGGTEGEKPPNGLYINVDNNYPNGETVYKGSYKKVTVNKNITFPAGIKFGYSTIENLQPFVDSLETTTDYSYMFYSYFAPHEPMMCPWGVLFAHTAIYPFCGIVIPRRENNATRAKFLENNYFLPYRA